MGIFPSFWPSSWRRPLYLRSPSSASVQQPHCPRHHPRSTPTNVEPVNLPRLWRDRPIKGGTGHNDLHLNYISNVTGKLCVSKRDSSIIGWKQWQMITYGFLLEDASSVQQHITNDHASRWDFWKRCCVSRSPAWHHSSLGHMDFCRKWRRIHINACYTWTNI